MTDRAHDALFLRTGSSARSPMAEAILNAAGGGRLRAFSAGLPPEDAPRPYPIDLLRRLNHDATGLRAKDWSEFKDAGAPRMDLVLAVRDRAAAETCPVWPSQPTTAHRGIPDAAATTCSGTGRRLAFSDALRMLSTRISLFLSLPLASIDRLALERRLDDIRPDRPGALRLSFTA